MGMLLTIGLLLFGALSLGAAMLFVVWLLSEPVQDDGDLVSPSGASLFRGLRRWISKPVPKLDYRRDKRGRFRKVRRG